MSVWGPLEFGRGWQRIRTAVEAAMKADYTDQVVRPALGEWVDAVSYTHLRAHETVLDLVCRLLLEKKKKNK